MPYHVSRGEFSRLVERALKDLPQPFAGALEEMTLEIRDRPTEQELESVGLGPDELLLGLYVGTPLTERTHQDTGRLPDKILIFQEDCELVSESKEQLMQEVRTTVLHELGHYFGLDEDELDRLGYG
ncbi:MAG: metallopeptidase family protein [Tepidisphaerales bacterium]